MGRDRAAKRITVCTNMQQPPATAHVRTPSAWLSGTAAFYAYGTFTWPTSLISPSRLATSFTGGGLLQAAKPAPPPHLSSCSQCGAVPSEELHEKVVPA